MADTGHSLTASGAVELIRDGKLKAVDLVRDCLSRISSTDERLKAWMCLDEERALERARQLDWRRQCGKPIGLLHGIPVGIKDIIDTADFPTECGSEIFKGRRPEANAFVIDRLNEAGAVILGKTKTTEFAHFHPTDTCNPNALDRTPGGSSSGSAAAVAAMQVPLALGSQTNGSMIRPASFCGVYGFKPSRGWISRSGVLQTSKSLDHVGVYGRTLHDIALIADAIAGHDSRDYLSEPYPRPCMREGAKSEVPVEPALAVIDLPYADRLEADAALAFETVCSTLADHIERIPAPDRFADLVGAQHTIHDYEIFLHLSPRVAGKEDLLSASMQSVFERAAQIDESEYDAAIRLMRSAGEYFELFFRDYDVILSPSAPGEAPLLSGGATGDPIFCTVWTLLGLPSISVPALVGDNGLPIGLQVIGGLQEDDRLCRTVGWITDQLKAGNAQGGVGS